MTVKRALFSYCIGKTHCRRVLSVLLTICEGDNFRKRRRRKFIFVQPVYL